MSGQFEKMAQAKDCNLSKDLKEHDIVAFPSSVGKRMKAYRISLRVNSKSIAEPHPPDRNRQIEIFPATRKQTKGTGCHCKQGSLGGDSIVTATGDCHLQTVQRQTPNIRNTAVAEKNI
jgi:hypothetical protein